MNFMKRTELIMGMPVTVEIRDGKPKIGDIEKVFAYFRSIDEKYSPYKDNSEVAKLNRREEVSLEMKRILSLAADLKEETGGYFDIQKPDGGIDPSGIVKGWAIKIAAEILRDIGYKKFYIDAGGDAEIVGRGWTWGIRNPFDKLENVKVLTLGNSGIATSGTYERGNHIYNPLTGFYMIPGIVSLTVIGPNVFEADKYATPAFAMGRAGIEFIEKKEGLEGYMIDKRGVATMTSGFSGYVKQ